MAYRITLQRERKHARIEAEHARGADPEGPDEYQDVPGFCKWATIEEIRRHGCVLTPGRYVSGEVREDDGEPFEEKMRRLVAHLRERTAQARTLGEAIARILAHLGF